VTWRADITPDEIRASADAQDEWAALLERRGGTEALATATAKRARAVKYRAEADQRAAEIAQRASDARERRSLGAKRAAATRARNRDPWGHRAAQERWAEYGRGQG
jgi:hypothetical protein